MADSNYYQLDNAYIMIVLVYMPGHVAQSIMCLLADTCLTADPGSWVLSQPGPILSCRLIIKYFLLSTAIVLPSADSRRVVVSYKRKNVHKVLVNLLVKLAQEKGKARWTDHPDMTIAVDWDVKHQTRPLVKSMYQNINFLIYQPKHMFWVSMRWFFWASKLYVQTYGLENINNFTLKNVVYLNLCQTKPKPCTYELNYVQISMSLWGISFLILIKFTYFISDHWIPWTWDSAASAGTFTWHLVISFSTGHPRVIVQTLF